ncbi:hypothetical protein NAG84_12795 [Proteus terrae]|uniref:hypothetical protein n=1 Tax=Proteus terrae TaxID=1574161 RepID=UPI002094C702|nr:hypothetical protein [Proteus terrae]MCO7050724.1 hypothetical protein [Proteus terrae]MCT8230169.1 hypothetical protein [Proteus terrae]MCW9688458.1 hypothetical protein [Proteus terrae]
MSFYIQNSNSNNDKTYKKSRTKILLIGLALIPSFVFANDLSQLPQKERVAYFTQAQQAGITGVAIKTKPVLARPAKESEIITTIIKGEGVETVSEPAKVGDWVVQNICPETGNEEILVRKAKFAQRYNPAEKSEINLASYPSGYQPFTPKGIEMNYFIVPESTPPFAMKAPWGELQRFQSGDAVVQSTKDNQDIYRIQKAAFECTYTILKPAKLAQ